MNFNLNSFSSINNPEVDQQVKCKEVIINTLINKTFENKRLLDCFNISEDNFSKSLRVELEKFSKEIKNSDSNKTVFTQNERDKLIVLNNVENSNDEEVSIKKINLMKKNIQNMNLKLKILKERLNTESNGPTNSNKFNEEDPIKQFEFIIKRIERIIGEDRISSDYDIIKESKLEQVNLIEKMKDEIITSNEDLEKLKIERNNLEKKINMYCNLPSDVNRIKAMIAEKREDLSRLSYT